MFWPPSGRANNKATISDSKFVAETEEAPRHAPYVMDATFLAPWMSWDDDEGPWSPSDPICRVLLLGESGIQLRSLNADDHGSIIQLTSGPVGLQSWEVVSFFDWYAEGETDKSSAMCWCRLWAGTEDDDDDDDEDEPEAPIAINSSFALEEGTSVWIAPGQFGVDGIEEDCMLVVAVIHKHTIELCTAVTVDGINLSLYEAFHDPMTNIRITLFNQPGITPGDGDIEVTFSGDVTEFHWHSLQMRGITTFDFTETEMAQGTGSTPSIDSGASPTGAAVNVIFVVNASNSAAGGELGYDAPFAANQDAELFEVFRSRSSWHITSVAAPWACSCSTSLADWMLMGTPFN